MQPLISLQTVRICGLKKYQKSDGVRGTTIGLDVHSSRKPNFVSFLTFHLEHVWTNTYEVPMGDVGCAQDRPQAQG